MVFSNAIFGVNKIRKIKQTHKTISILNFVWSLFGRSVLLECHLYITMVYEELIHPVGLSRVANYGTSTRGTFTHFCVVQTSRGYRERRDLHKSRSVKENPSPAGVRLVRFLLLVFHSIAPRRGQGATSSILRLITSQTKNYALLCCKAPWKKCRGNTRRSQSVFPTPCLTAMAGDDDVPCTMELARRTGSMVVNL